MMENAALVSLEGNTAQRDLGSCFILKAGFFFIKLINLALLPASDWEPSGRVGRFYPVFPALCDTGAWKHPSHHSQGWPSQDAWGYSGRGRGAAPGLVRSSSRAGLPCAWEPQNLMTVSESKKGLEQSKP